MRMQHAIGALYSMIERDEASLKDNEYSMRNAQESLDYMTKTRERLTSHYNELKRELAVLEKMK